MDAEVKQLRDETERINYTDGSKSIQQVTLVVL